MGIRFYCPKGHKLNVKEFQAGRTGVCPYCGEKMAIPAESTRQSSKWKSTATAEPVASSRQPAGAASAVRMPRGVTSVAGGQSDPLAECEKIAWHVRSAGGQQYGPVDVETMRAWLAEQRIAADSLVWREGWREWRTAGDVFPQLSSDEAVHAAPPSLPPMRIVHSPHTLPLPNRRRTNERTTRLIVIVSLAVIAAALSITLLIVLCRQ